MAPLESLEINVVHGKTSDKPSSSDIGETCEREEICSERINHVRNLD